ncbi:MAG: ABC-type transport auxiliary lipoprotein family protein [Desulfovibrionaceae bacterium]
MRRFFLCCAVAVLALAAGCGPAIKQQAPDKIYFVLEAPRPVDAPRVQAPLGGALTVRKLSVSPAYESRELLYRAAEGRLQPDYYNQFIVPPEDMASQAVRQWLGDTGLFAGVGLPGSGMRNEFVLEGGLTALYGDFTAPQAKAVLKAQFFLFLARGSYDLVLHKEYSEAIPLRERSAAGLVAGLNTALGNVLAALEADVKARLAQ